MNEEKEVKIYRYSPSPYPLVSICIPLYEKDEWYEQAIESIKSHDAGIPYEIVTAECKQSCAKNRNAAQREAKCDYICQYDGDADVISDGWLRELYFTLIMNKKIGVVGIISVLPNGQIDHPGAVLLQNKELIDTKIDFDFPSESEETRKLFKQRVNGYMTQVIPYEPNKEQIDGRIYDVKQCTGVAFLYDRRRQGEFSEKTYSYGSGWDDVDFFQQVNERGYNIVVNSNVRIKHPNHERSEQEKDVRTNVNSDRCFSGQNYVNYLLRWGML